MILPDKIPSKNFVYLYTVFLFSCCIFEAYFSYFTTFALMSYDWNSRTELLLGTERVKYLANCHVLVVGLGGVGAYAAEQICRAGVGRMTLIDADTVQESNINRQLPALHSTLGKSKAEVVAKRLADINPEIKLTVLQEFLRDERTEEVLNASEYDFVVDAIDSLSPKVFLLYHAIQKSIPVVSSMGAGAKVDPSQVKIADISQTHNCALAKAVRKRLRDKGINKGVPVVFSTEMANPEAVIEVDNEMCKRTTTGTVSYMPAVFGCFLASYVIRNI